MRGLFFGGTLAGALLGFGLGLAATRLVWPIPVWGVSPAELRRDLKDDYIRMIASSYSLDGDTAHAFQRLASLKLTSPDSYLSDLAIRDSSSLYGGAVVRLVLDLKQPSVALARPTYTPRPTRTRERLGLGLVVSPSPEPSPTPTTTTPAVTAVPPRTFTLLPAIPTPRLPLSTGPTATEPTLTPSAPPPFFGLKSSDWLNCLATQGRGLIEVEVQEPDGRPVPGIAVELSWDGGEQVFYTGLKPERGMGYADVEVSPGIYRLWLTEDAGSPVVDNLRIDAEPEECPGDGSELRGWKVVFQRSN